MTDEEKKAIKDCDSIFICLDDAMSEDSANYYRKSYKILKNLLEKQSKEIEHQKEKNNGLEIKANELNNLADVVKRDYIHKDIIKAKIEELKQEKSEYEDTPEWELFDYLDGQIQVLQSFLEKE